MTQTRLKFRDIKVGQKFQYVGKVDFPYGIRSCILKKISPRKYRFVIRGDMEQFNMTANADVIRAIDAK
jgi:hypothetical protein